MLHFLMFRVVWVVRVVMRKWILMNDGNSYFTDDECS